MNKPFLISVTTGRLRGDWILIFYQDELHAVFECSEKLKVVFPTILPDSFRTFFIDD